jgi:hypothetical protein
LTMSKKEIDTILAEIQEMTNELEKRRKKNDDTVLSCSN